MLPARRPYPDELASSALLRCCREFNMPIKRLGQVYFDRNGWRPSFLGATPLESLAQLFRRPAEDLLWDHTTFPYATATMHPEHFRRALANAFGSASQGVGLGAVTQNASVGLTRRRYCHHCMDADIKQYFESYWHRSHNLPGVWVCVLHGTYLLESNAPIASSGSFDRRLPHQCAGQSLGKGTPSPTLLRIAKLSIDWLHRPHTAGTAPTAEDYRTLAQAGGWLSTDRQVSSTKLATALQHCIPHELLDQSSLTLESGWPALMMRSGVDVPFSPLKHALLCSLLQQTRPKSVPPLDHIPTGPPRSVESQLDEFYAAAADAQLRCTLASRRTLTTEQFLRAAGCWGRYKHQKDSLPKLKAVVRLFRASSASVKRLSTHKCLYRSERAAPPTTRVDE